MYISRAKIVSESQKMPNHELTCINDNNDNNNKNYM